MGTRTWNFWFCHFKVFRLHAILHDAAGAVRVHSGKGPGYCYKFEVVCRIVLDTEGADKNFFRELAVFIDGKAHGFSFRHPRKYKPTKQAFWCAIICTELCRSVDVWIRVSFQTFFLEF